MARLYRVHHRGSGAHGLVQHHNGFRYGGPRQSHNRAIGNPYALHARCSGRACAECTFGQYPARPQYRAASYRRCQGSDSPAHRFDYDESGNPIESLGAYLRFWLGKSVLLWRDATADGYLDHDRNPGYPDPLGDTYNPRPNTNPDEQHAVRLAVALRAGRVLRMSAAMFNRSERDAMKTKRARQPKSPSARIGYLCDPGGDTEAERQNIESSLQDLGIAFHIAYFSQEGAYRFLQADPYLDVLFIDYGGMSVMGAHDTAKSNVRGVKNYADNHPGTLIVFWTEFTSELYREVSEEFGAIDNCVCRTFDDDTTWATRVQQWCAMAKEE